MEREEHLHLHVHVENLDKILSISSTLKHLMNLEERIIQIVTDYIAEQAAVNADLKLSIKSLKS